MKAKNLFGVLLVSSILSAIACDPQYDPEDLEDDSDYAVMRLATCTNDEWIDQYIECRNEDLEAPSKKCFDQVNDACSS